MMNIHFSISTNGNAAFADEPATEIARILRETAKRIEDGDFPEGVTPVHDINGNKCGHFTMIEDGEDPE